MATPPTTLLQQAMEAYRQRRLVVAESLCRDALKHDHLSFQVNYFLGLVLFEQHKAEEARAFAATALKRNPASVDAVMLLGSAELSLGKSEEALGYFNRAVVAQPRRVDVRYNRAVALERARRLPQALVDYDYIVATQPNFAAGWFNRSVVLAGLGRHEEAVASLDRTLALEPSNAEAWNNRGNVLAMLGRHEAAVASFDRLLSQRSDAAALSNRAISLHALGRHDDALCDCERALSINPAHTNSLITRGNILHALGRYDEAIACYDLALVRSPTDIQIVINRGISLLELGRFEEALDAGEQAITIDPNDAAAYVARAKALQALARYLEAARDYSGALALNKDVADAAANLRVCHLRLGKFKEGWSGHQPHILKYTQQRWDGGYVPGTLLIWCDEGIGDQVIYSGAIAEAAARAERLVVEVDPRLVDLFRRSFPQISVVAASSEPYSLQTDAQDVASGLAKHLRQSWGDFPQRDQGFLKPDINRVRELRHRLASRGPVIGLTWISRNPTIGRFKSARLQDFGHLLRLPGYRFVDLQYGDTTEERQIVERELSVRVERIEEVDNTNDLDGLAALSAACDVVLTVSSTTAHLAGAVGTRTFVMVPYGRGHLWYWFADRSQSPWYPRLTVHRQQPGQSWDGLVATLVPEIKAAASQTWRSPTE